MVVIKDVAWFHEHHGLQNFGEHLLALSKKEIPKLKIYEVFGPMSSKSKWKFKNKITPEVAVQIVELYQKFYDQEEVTNNEIPQKFARALIIKLDPKH
jgi:hypothetical protein